MSSDDVKEAIDSADMDSVAEDVEEIDEDRSRWDKAPYWGWLLLVFGGAAAVILWAIDTGRFDFAFQFTGAVDLSGPLQEAVTWGVRILIFITAIAALVVAPGDYLATILRVLDGFSYPSNEDE